MRIVLAVGVWIVFAGGLGIYMSQRDSGRTGPSLRATVEAAQETYEAEVTLTFDVEPDPFALDTGESVAGLLVRLNGETVLRASEGVAAGDPVRVELENVVRGANEVYVEVSPPVGAARASHAARVRIFRGGVPGREETFWSEGGGKVTCVLAFEAVSEEAAHEH